MMQSSGMVRFWIPRKSIILGTAIAFELGYALILVYKLPFSIALVLHANACLAFAYVFPNYLRSRYQMAQLNTYLFCFVIPFYMPLLGMLGLILAFLPGLPCSKRENSSLPMRFNSSRELPSHSELNPSLVSPYEEGRLEGILMSRDPERRLSALIGTLKLRDKDAIRILRQALRDPVDDIRLLAYSLLDRKENVIRQRIQSQLRNMESSYEVKSPEFYKQISSDYWELVYLGLVQGETLTHTLDTARQYIETGLKHYPRNAGLHFHLARLFLRMGKQTEAVREFKKAEQLGIERKLLLTYYAEIEFTRQQYGEIGQYLLDIDRETTDPQLAATVRFWEQFAV